MRIQLGFFQPDKHAMGCFPHGFSNIPMLGGFTPTPTTWIVPGKR
jgi:hypothetical protein